MAKIKHLTQACKLSQCPLVLLYRQTCPLSTEKALEKALSWQKDKQRHWKPVPRLGKCPTLWSVSTCGNLEKKKKRNFTFVMAK